MRSVADDLRDEGRRRVLAMTPDERRELALRLGDEDVDLFSRARGLSEADARRVITRRRQHGRRPSRAAQR
jgi:hypothetical protein